MAIMFLFQVFVQHHVWEGQFKALLAGELVGQFNFFKPMGASEEGQTWLMSFFVLLLWRDTHAQANISGQHGGFGRMAAAVKRYPPTSSQCAT